MLKLFTGLMGPNITYISDGAIVLVTFVHWVHYNDVCIYRKKLYKNVIIVLDYYNYLHNIHIYKLNPLTI